MDADIVIAAETRLELADALRLKQAELWLEVREPLLALQELDGLSSEVCAHPWARSLLQAACSHFSLHISPPSQSPPTPVHAA